MVMNIHEFVKDVLVDLDKAVEEARQQTQRNISFSHTTDRRSVEFDIAVTVEETDARSGKAGIKVLELVQAGGDSLKENKNSTVSRIQFGVHIDPMTRDEQSVHDSALRIAQEQTNQQSLY
jgi:hypothetical protein